MPCTPCGTAGARSSDTARQVVRPGRQTEAMEPTVVIAGIGLVTTASSPLLQSWLTARNAEAAWRRDALAGVYADALAHAQSLESLIERVTDPYGSHAKRAEVPHVDLIAARLRLHAPQAVLAAWQEVRLREDQLRWNLQENYPGLGLGDDAVPADAPEVLKLTAAINIFFNVVRKSIGS
jgi:hypothetical protein